MFLRKEELKASSPFCRNGILTKGMFLAELPSNAKISVLRIMWVTKNCRFVSDQIFLDMRTSIPQELYSTDVRLLYKDGFVLWYNAYKTKEKKNAVPAVKAARERLF